MALDAESIGYVLLFILVVVFTVFPLTAFIYSMIFARFHHASNHKKLLSREKYVMQSLGKDNLHTLSTPVPNRKISKAGLVMSNITVAPSWWQLFLGTIRSIFGGNIER